MMDGEVVGHEDDFAINYVSSVIFFILAINLLIG